MSGDLVGLLVALAVTVLPVGLSAWWGTRRARRRAEALARYTAGIGRLGVTFRAFGSSCADAAAGIARLGELVREADDG